MCTHMEKLLEIQNNTNWLKHIYIYTHTHTHTQTYAINDWQLKRYIDSLNQKIAYIIAEKTLHCKWQNCY